MSYDALTYRATLSSLIARYAKQWARTAAALAELERNEARLRETRRKLSRPHEIAFRRDSRDYRDMY